MTKIVFYKFYSVYKQGQYVFQTQASICSKYHLMKEILVKPNSIVLSRNSSFSCKIRFNTVLLLARYPTVRCVERRKKEMYFLLVFVLCLPHMQVKKEAEKKERKKKKGKKKRSHFCENRVFNPNTDKGGTLQILAQASYISKATG